MRKWIVVGALAMVMCGSGAWFVDAQVQPNNPRPAPPLQVQPPPQIISGADFGFRVDTVAADGSLTGKIVVRQNGAWVEVRISPSARRLTTN